MARDDTEKRSSKKRSSKKKTAKKKTTTRKRAPRTPAPSELRAAGRPRLVILEGGLKDEEEPDDDDWEPTPAFYLNSSRRLVTLLTDYLDELELLLCKDDDRVS